MGPDFKKMNKWEDTNLMEFVLLNPVLCVLICVFLFVLFLLGTALPVLWIASSDYLFAIFKSMFLIFTSMVIIFKQIWGNKFTDMRKC